MMSLPNVLDKRLKEAVPSRTSWIEAWGVVLLGLGVYFALACYSFNPYDYAAGGVRAKVHNLGGPLGAYCAAHILGRFGVIGMLWPVIMVLWGSATTTGFVVLPRPKRFLGLVLFMGIAAGCLEMLLPRYGLPEPTFGFGGLIGQMLRRFFRPKLGYSGTMIALTMAAFVSLQLTGNLKLSKIAEYFETIKFFAKRIGRKFYKKVIVQFVWRKVIVEELWIRLILNQDPPAPAERVASGARKYDDGGSEKPRRPRSVKEEEPQREPRDASEPAIVGGAEMRLYYEGPAHGKADASLFSRSKKQPDRSKDFKETAEHLVEQLAQFKIDGEINAVTQGPVVTTFEFKPAPGTKVSKISALGEDLARLLKAQSLRVLAPIPGKDTVGFEVPNADRATIGFADLIDSPQFKERKKKLPIAMGVDIFGKPVVEDLAEMPHLLVAGSTGSGKSVFMNTLIGSLICRHTAKDLRFIMIDPKMVEMAAYNDLPHLACPVITDPQTDAKAALDALVVEMDDRYRKMRAVGARNIDSFNEIIKSRKRTEFIDFEGKWVTMPYVVLIIDEMADMMMLLGKDAETPITRLAQKARAAGIHMVIATQRPSAEVVTGLIKANFPTRVAFRVMSGIDSRTILDQNGAETLLGKGDMLYLASGGAQRMHGAFLPEGEVHAMVKAVSRKVK